MEKAIKATQQEFESSSSQTPEYRAWHRFFKREFTHFLEAHRCANIAIGKGSLLIETVPGRFGISVLETSVGAKNPCWSEQPRATTTTSVWFTEQRILKPHWSA
jgi:hypothetical protein